MSTTTWVEPTRSTSSSASRSAPSSRPSAGLDDERLAEDAGGLGERHRQPPLERRAAGQRGVVVGVAELVGGGLRRVERARPVEQHERAVVDERHAERAAGLAVAWAGVDPLLVERPVDEPGELGAVGRERARARCRCPRPTRRRRRASGSGATRSHHWQPARRGRAGVALSRIHRRKSGSDVDDRRLHRVERRPADAVGEQRGVERAAQRAPAVDDVGLALDRVHRRRARRGDRRPRLHLGVVGGPAHRWVGDASRGRARPASAALDAAVGQRRPSARQLRRDVALQAAPRRRAGGRRARRTAPPRPRSSGGRRARRGAAAVRGARGLVARRRPARRRRARCTQSARRASSGRTGASSDARAR